VHGRESERECVCLYVCVHVHTYTHTFSLSLSLNLSLSLTPTHPHRHKNKHTHSLSHTHPPPHKKKKKKPPPPPPPGKDSGTLMGNIMTDSTENVAPLKSTTSRYSNFTVQIQIEPESQFEFVPRDNEESEFFDLVDFWDVAIAVDTIILIPPTAGGLRMICV